MQKLKFSEESEFEKNQMEEQNRYEGLDSCKEKKF